MRKFIAPSVLAFIIAAASPVPAHSDKLPPGPIHDRHELMERIGDNAEVIGDAMKAGDLAPVAGAAEKIHADAGKALAMFPKGSTHPESRSKPEIWDNWDKFEKLMKELETKSADLAAAAKNKGDVGAAAKAMFGNCKGCHEDFRKPDDENEKKS